MPIFYKSGYRYQLAEDYVFFLPGGVATVGAVGQFIRVAGRQVTVRAGYAWDGASKPAINTVNFRRGSLEHDVCYQLMREGKINLLWRNVIDKRLIKTCKEDGMSWIRLKWVYIGVKYGARSAALPRNLKKVHKAGK